MLSAADFHLHSRSSARLAEWVLRRLDHSDSTSALLALYRRLRRAGMQFVTLTDHKSIEGCLSIAGEPGVSCSEQVSSQFPKDRAWVEILAWGIEG